MLRIDPKYLDENRRKNSFEKDFFKLMNNSGASAREARQRSTMGKTIKPRKFANDVSVRTGKGSVSRYSSWSLIREIKECHLPLRFFL